MITEKQLAKRIATEKRIITLTVRTLIAAGFELTVNNGDDEELPSHSRKAKEVLAVMHETDDEYLIARKPGSERNFGWVRFVYGNDGWDAICDHTCNLTNALAPVLALSDKLADLA